MNSLLPSLLLSTAALSLLVLGDNPTLEVKKLAGRTKDRSLVKSRIFELNRGSQVAYEEFRYLQLLYTSISALLVFTLTSVSHKSIVATSFLSISIAAATYLYVDRNLTLRYPCEFSAIRLKALSGDSPAEIANVSISMIAGNSASIALRCFLTATVRVRSI